MSTPHTVVFLSYYGPEEAASGIRAGRLARAAARIVERVILVHGGDRPRRETWNDGIELVAFRRPFSRAAETPHSDLSPRGIPRRVAALVRRSLVQPDRFVLARRAFLALATSEIRTAQASGNRVTAILSAPPWSTALLGSRIPSVANTRILADLQDLWASNPEARWPLFGRRFALHWQRRLFDAAHGFLFVNEQIRARYEELNPQIRTKPRAVAPIGFEQPLAACLQVPAHEPLHIGYFGSIYGGRSFAPLLDRFVALPESLPRPTLHWYGDILGDHPLRHQYEGYARQGLLVHHAPLPFREARARMRSYHLLLVVPSPQYPEELTTKFYDYLEAGKPILALTPERTLLRSLVEAARVGIAVSPAQPAAIDHALHGLVSGGLTLYPEQLVLEPHRLPALSQALHEVLEGVHGAST